MVFARLAESANNKPRLYTIYVYMHILQDRCVLIRILARHFIMAALADCYGEHEQGGIEYEGSENFMDEIEDCASVLLQQFIVLE